MRGVLRLIFGVGAAVLVCFILLPVPSEMANFWIGCGSGNFQPSDQCNRMCRMLGNLTSCCYGVDHAGRSACGCCRDSRDCPPHCNGNCAMVQITTNNCQGDNPTQIVPKDDGSGGLDDKLQQEQQNCLEEFYHGPDLLPVGSVDLSISSYRQKSS